MSERIHVLAQQLFGKSSVADCDLQEIKNIVDRYPYFAPAQFLLLEKLRQTSSADYAVQLQKAVLYYHNPLEFEYFISSDTFYSENIKEVDKIENLAVNNEQPNYIRDDIKNQPTSVQKKEAIELPTFTTPLNPNGDTQMGNGEESEANVEGLDILEKKLLQINESPPIEEQELPNVSTSFSLNLQQPVSSSDLTFEPFHTVDYFASQGIKLSQEEVSKDKLGKQLKSFTEWLKTMKRLPSTELKIQTESTTEKKVQHLVDDSVHESNVVTEAMAEVWLKQGNTHKAIDIYNKLSLQNPSKMAYFAAKIDNIKSI